MSEPMEVDFVIDESPMEMNEENLPPPPPPISVLKGTSFGVQSTVRSPLKDMSNTANAVSETFTTDKQPSSVNDSSHDINVINKTLPHIKSNVSGQDILQSRIDQLERDKVDLTLQLHIREEKDR